MSFYPQVVSGRGIQTAYLKFQKSQVRQLFLSLGFMQERQDSWQAEQVGSAFVMCFGRMHCLKQHCWEGHIALYSVVHSVGDPSHVSNLISTGNSLSQAVHVSIVSRHTLHGLLHSVHIPFTIAFPSLHLQISSEYLVEFQLSVSSSLHVLQVFGFEQVLQPSLQGIHHSLEA